jgi:murein DD-endopeptidase MepM/ murein hydrolase activator NlpD
MSGSAGVRSWGVALALAAAACGGDSGGGPPAGVRFGSPLDGTLNQTFFYLNYVDDAAGSGIQDYTCGPKTYDGHLGTDITLPSFAVMDSGVAVRAVAGGTVIGTHDGEFDHQKSWIDGAMWNYVAIRHADGVQTIYGHLKQNSVAVLDGQGVAAGTVLGQVGSSGISDIPHLHLEVRDRNGAVIDPWRGPCGASASRWAAQLAYQNTFSLFAAGLTDAELTLDLVKDPPARVDMFTTASARVTMWVELFNVRAGTPAEFRLYPPDGGPYEALAFEHDRFYGLSWWWVWHDISGVLTQLGTWRMQYRQSGALLAERSFVLVAAAAGAQAAPPVAPAARMGIGGGGVRGP